MQTRLLYIDKLKALAMLLVVLGHTIFFCIWHEQQFNDPIFNIICTCHVHLFFFLSGFVISQPPTPHKFLCKARRFLVPMITVGFINALLIAKVREFFLTGGHNGYWYLLTLTLFYLFMIPFRNNSEKKNGVSFLFDALLAIGIWLLFFFFNHLSGTIVHPFNFFGAYSFWPYFVIGYVCRKYSLVRYITDNHWMTTGLVLTYLVLLIVFFQKINNLPFVLEFTIAILAIAALVSLFHHFSNSHTFIDRQLLLIGNNTLNIYLFHYFFIRFIDLSALQNKSRIAEFVIIVPLAIVIAYSSIGLGRLWNKLLQNLRLNTDER